MTHMLVSQQEVRLKTIYLPYNTLSKEVLARRLLIVTCVEYTKAFDSIKLEKLIETLIHYKVHYKIIEVVANIYKDDCTEVHFEAITKKERNNNRHKAMLYSVQDQQYFLNLLHMIMTE